MPLFPWLQFLPPCSSLVVIYDNKRHKQNYYTGHGENVVSCIDSHKALKVACSGEIAQNPRIHIWDVTTGKNRCVFGNLHSDGISCLAFSRSGAFVASIGMDAKNRVVIYDWKTETMIACGQAGDGRFTSLVPSLKENTFF